MSYNFLFVQVANENKSKHARYKVATIMGKSVVPNDMFPGDQKRTIEMLDQYKSKTGPLYLTLHGLYRRLQYGARQVPHLETTAKRPV